MAASVPLAFRIATDLNEFRRNMLEMRTQLETTKQAMQKMANSLDGSKVIADANAMVKAVADIGGASKLTEAEQRRVNSTVQEALAKYQALGREAPVALKQLGAETQRAQSVTERFTGWIGQANTLLGLFGASIGIGALVSFGKELLRTGDELVRVADRTGLTTEEVQRLQFIAGQSGNSLDELTGAIGKLQANLVRGDKGAVQAVQALKLNLSDLRAANPFAQMEQVATAIAKIPDPAGRAALAMELFGRGGIAIMPTLIANFKGLGEAAPVMRDKTVRSLEQAGDTLQKFVTQVKVWAAESFNFVSNLFDRLIAWGFRVTAGMLNAIAAVGEIAQNIPGAAKAMELLGVSTDDVRQRAQQFRDAATAQIERIERIEPATRPAVTGLLDLSDATEQAAKQAEKMAQVWEDTQEKIRKATTVYPALTAEEMAAVSELVQFGLTTEEIARQLDLAEVQVRRAAESLGGLRQQIEAIEGPGRGVIVTTLSLTDALNRIDMTLDDTDPVIRRYQAGLNVIESGSGDLNRALTSLGGTLTDVWLEYIRWVNSLEFTGPTLKQAEREVESFGQRIRDVFTKSLGGLNDIFQRAFEGGGGVKGAIKSFATNALQGVLEMIPGVGKVLGQFAGAITAGFGKLFGGLFGGEEKKINPIREAFVQAAGGLEILNQKAAEAGVTLDALLQAKKVKDYEQAVKDLNNAFAFQEQAMQTLQETIKKYGFTIEELGPKFAAQELDKKAQELFQDYQILIAAGIDNGIVVSKMADATNAYVRQALTMGVEVPSAMKPMIDKMIEMGLLTDASGNKIGSLEESGIVFAETMTQNFDRLIEEVKKLTDAIARGLGIAIDQTAEKIRQFPRDIKVRVDFEVPDFPNNDLPGFQHGSGGIRDFGRGSLAVLHGREGVFTEAQLRGSSVNFNADGIEQRLERIERQFRSLPDYIGFAVRDAILRAA